MDKKKAKVRGIITAICLIAAAFGLRAAKNAIFSGDNRHPKNEITVAVNDSYPDYRDEGRKTVLVVRYEIFNGTAEAAPYATTFRDYALQDGKECKRNLTGTGLPTDMPGSLKAIEPGETMFFTVEYEISSKKGNIELCVDKTFVQENRERLRMTLDPNTGKEI